MTAQRSSGDVAILFI